MRTVWLALLCLIGLATTVVVKIGMSPYASADVSRGVTSTKAEVSRGTALTDSVALSSDVTAGTNLQSNPSTKADKLEVSYTNEPPSEVKSIKSVAVGLPTTEPKQPSEKMERIVNRHWHDPLSVPVAPRPSTRRKVSKTSPDRPVVAAHAPKS